MTKILTEEGKEDLLSRGYSRRQMLRSAVLIGGASALSAFSPEMAWAQDDAVKAEHTHAKIRIGQNECWTGPFAVGVAAGSAILARSNRYMPNDERCRLHLAPSPGIENVPEDHIFALARLGRTLDPHGGRLLLARQGPGHRRARLTKPPARAAQYLQGAGQGGAS